MLEESISAENEYELEAAINTNNQKQLLNKTKKNNLDSIVKLFILYVLSIPIAFADISFANSNTQCVKQDIAHFCINMYDYLLISGLYTFIMIVILVGIIVSVDYAKIKKDKFVELLINYYNRLNLLFLLFINIIASVMFWSFFDINMCDNQIYIYLFTSLIIKLVGNFIYFIKLLYYT
jgi:hypothetical protein